MGISSTTRGLPKLLKVALFLLLVGNVISWTAYTTTSWGRSFPYGSDGRLDENMNSHGLWRVCTGIHLTYSRVGWMDFCVDAYVGTTVAWFAAVQAFVTLGFVGHMLGFILILAYLLGKDDSDLVVLTGIICIVAGGLYLIGIIIYGVKTESFFAEQYRGFKLSWSFWLAVAAVAIGDVAGLLFLVGGRRLKRTSAPASAQTC